MILVTGGSGHIGSRVTELLVAKEVPLRVMSRTPDHFAASKRFEAIYGDFEDPQSLDRAFKGVKTAFVVSGTAMPGQRCYEHKAAFDAAKRAGVEHVVYLSLKGASPESLYPYCRDHYESEKFLAETGMSFSSLRNSFYLDMFLQKFGPDGILRAPAGDGKGAFISREDAAQAAAAAVLNPPVGVVEVTGLEELSVKEIVDILAKQINIKLQYQSEAIDVMEARLQGALNDEWKRELEIGWFAAIANGEQLPVTDSFKIMTGRDPQTVEQYFAEFPELLDPLRDQLTRHAA